MSKHEDAVRLRHMLDAAQKGVEFLKGRSRRDLETDEKLTLALVRLLEILGEAAKSVSADLRQRHPEIPWKDIAGTRDRLIHGYFDVDLDIVWQIMTADLPTLIAELQRVVSLES
ncbi:MAG: DUF86 domain-containing protein [Candidatus Omnitrophica bacterium]|nr:DUF86 domain-containing protein [Candidatus Omnitrophota bacterium]